MRQLRSIIYFYIFSALILFLFDGDGDYFGNQVAWQHTFTIFQFSVLQHLLCYVRIAVISHEKCRIQYRLQNYRTKHIIISANRKPYGLWCLGSPFAWLFVCASATTRISLFRESCSDVYVRLKQDKRHINSNILPQILLPKNTPEIFQEK